MPRYRPETAEAKAKALTSLYIRKNYNGADVAREEGVSRSAISQRLKQLPVKKTLQDTINENLRKVGTTVRKVYKANDEQLSATRTISAVISPNGEQKDANGQTCDFVEVPDWNARDKALDRTFVLMGHVKHTNGNGKGGVSAVIINITNKTGLCSEAETEKLSLLRS